MPDPMPREVGDTPRATTEAGRALYELPTFDRRLSGSIPAIEEQARAGVTKEQAAQAILRLLAATLTQAAQKAGVDLVRLDKDDVRIWHTDGNEAADILAALTEESAVSR